nr:hypothetical protein [Massilia forsythiae]
MIGQADVHGDVLGLVWRQRFGEYCAPDAEAGYCGNVVFAAQPKTRKECFGRARACFVCKLCRERETPTFLVGVNLDRHPFGVDSALSFEIVTTCTPINQAAARHTGYCQVARFKHAARSPCRVFCGLCIDIGCARCHALVKCRFAFFPLFDFESIDHFARKTHFRLDRYVDQEPPDTYRFHVFSHFRYLGSVPHAANLAGPPTPRADQGRQQDDDSAPSVFPYSHHGNF